jgi:hypothetical protein
MGMGKGDIGIGKGEYGDGGGGCQEGEVGKEGDMRMGDGNMEMGNMGKGQGDMGRGVWEVGGEHGDGREENEYGVRRMGKEKVEGVEGVGNMQDGECGEGEGHTWKGRGE